MLHYKIWLCHVPKGLTCKRIQLCGEGASSFVEMGGFENNRRGYQAAKQEDQITVLNIKM